MIKFDVIVLILKIIWLEPFTIGVLAEDARRAKTAMRAKAREEEKHEHAEETKHAETFLNDADLTA